MPSDPTLYLYTSLTAGSSHIITATSRIETILKANKIPFKAVDCATDDKARMLWQRRSKGRKIPGLVKFNDVIADLDQVEEWNEYGELEDQIEDQIDIFGDVPISGTSAEAQAAAAARLSNRGSQARTASETRHISISDPKGDARKLSESEDGGGEKQESPLSMAMRQAGVEAAAKANEAQTKPSTSGVVGPSETQTRAEESQSTSQDSPPGSGPAKLDPDAEDVSAVETGARTPEQLASQGQKKTSVDRLGGSLEDEGQKKSNAEQVLEQRRQSSVVQNSSSLAKSTSIDESHTVTASEDIDSSSDKRESMPPPSADKQAINEREKAIAEDDGKGKVDGDKGENEDGDDEPVKKAARISATDEGEEKVLQGTKPQELEAADGDEAGKSVGD